MMLTIIDSTAQCVPLVPHVLRPENVAAGWVVVHRLSLATRTDANPNPIPDDKLTGAEAELRFRNKDLGTGGVMAYHAFVHQGGRVEQNLPLLVRGSHAGGYNWQSWAIAAIGNTDEREMPDKQWHTMIEVCAVLSVLPRKVSGHTELPGGSHDPGKRCPGKFINMDQVRAEVEKKLPYGSEHWDIRQRLAFVTGAGFSL
jgi:hypothetical protein